MRYDFNAFAPLSVSANAIGFAAGAGLPAGFRVFIFGTNLSYDSATGLMSGDISSLSLWDYSGPQPSRVQTISVQNQNAATLAQDISSFLQKALLRADRDILCLGTPEPRPHIIWRDCRYQRHTGRLGAVGCRRATPSATCGCMAAARRRTRRRCTRQHRSNLAVRAPRRGWAMRWLVKPWISMPMDTGKLQLRSP